MRTMQTSRIVAKEAGYNEENILANSAIYLSQEDDVLEIIKQTGDAVDSLLLTGHNPTISGLAGKLTGSFHQSMQTAALMAIAFDVKSWKEINYRKGKELYMLLPEG